MKDKKKAFYGVFDKDGVYKIYKKSPCSYSLTFEEFKAKYSLYPYCTAERVLQKKSGINENKAYTIEHFLLHSKDYIKIPYELTLDNMQDSYLNDFEKRLLAFLNISFLENIYKIQKDRVLINCDSLQEIASFIVSNNFNCIYIDKKEMANILGFKDINQSSYNIDKSLKRIARHLYTGAYKDKSTRLARFSTITLIDSVEDKAGYFIVKLGATYTSLLTLGTAIPYYIGFLALNEKNHKRVRATGEYLGALEHIQKNATNKGSVTIGSLRQNIGNVTIENRKDSEAKALFRIMNTLKAIGFLKEYSFIIKGKQGEALELSSIKELASVEHIEKVIIKYSTFISS